MGGWKFYFPLFTHWNINSPKRNLSITDSICLPCCALCPDLVIMAALCTGCNVSGERIVPLSPPVTHLASSVQTLVTGPQLPPRDVRVLCRYFIPHFTSLDFTMHKQSKFRERSSVRSCTESASDRAGHTCTVLGSLHSREHFTLLHESFTDNYSSMTDSEIPCTSIRTWFNL